MAEPWLNRRCADVEQFRIPRRLPQDRVQSGCGAPAGTGIVPGGGEQAAQAGSPGNCPGWRSGSRAVGCAWCRSVSRPASPASPAPRGGLTWSCTLTSFSSWCLTDGTVGGRRSTCMASGAPHSPIGGALDGGVQHQVQQQLHATPHLLAGAELQIAAGAHEPAARPFPFTKVVPQVRSVLLGRSRQTLRQGRTISLRPCSSYSITGTFCSRAETRCGSWRHRSCGDARGL